MIKMKMAHDDGLNVFDVIASFPNGNIQVMILAIVLPSKDVVELWSPNVWIIFARTSLEEHESFSRMRDQSTHHYH